SASWFKPASIDPGAVGAELQVTRKPRMNTTRRRFLQTLAGAASLGLPNVPLLGELAAFGAEAPPATVRFGADIEPGVRLIDETPRDRCVAVFLDQLRRGQLWSRKADMLPRAGAAFVRRDYWFA